MAKQEIDIGVEGNDGTGDSIRESFRKVNENFNELYAVFGAGGQISFTNLGDTPNQLLPRKMLLVNDAANAIDFVDLASDSAITPGADDSVVISYDIAGKVVLQTSFRSVASDTLPTLGGPLDGFGYGIANVAITQDAVNEFNTKHSGDDITIDDLVITKGYADNRYIAGDLPVRIDDEPNDASEYVLTVESYTDGNFVVADHGYDRTINGTPFIFQAEDTDPSNLTSGTTYYLRYYNKDQLSIHRTREEATVQSQATADSNRIYVTYTIAVDDTHTFTDAGYDETLEGFFLSDEAMPRKSIVRRQGDTMTGPLILHDSPGELAGLTSSPEDLQAATKFYVDNTAYSSPTNLFVSTTGDDTMAGVPAGKEGTSWSYAYRTINAAARRADEIMQASEREPGPYMQTITRDNGAADAEVVSAGINSPLFGQARALIQLNREFIIREITAYLNFEYPGFEYNIETCERDLGLILDAIAIDINRSQSTTVATANSLTRIAAERYYSNASGKLAITRQLTETVDAIEKARDIVAAILINRPYLQSSISAISQSTICRLTTATGHGLENGNIISVKNIVGMTELNDNFYYVKVISSTILELFTDEDLTVPVNSAAFTAYSSGGIIGLVYQTDNKQYFDIGNDAGTVERQGITDKFDLITNIIQNGVDAGANTVYGKTYKIVVNNGGLAATDQGNASNRDVLPGKVIVGKISGAQGRIVSYTANSPTDGGNDAIEVHLLKAIEFIDGETLEFGNFVNRNQVTIMIETGQYEEDYPIRVANNVSIKGDEFRRVIIRPKDRVSQSPWAGTYIYRDLEFDGITTSEGGYRFYNQTGDWQGYFGYHYLADPEKPQNTGISVVNAGGYESAAAIIKENKAFIQEEIINYINNNFQDLLYDKTQFRDDLTAIITGITYDIVLGTNYNQVLYGLKFQRSKSIYLDSYLKELWVEGLNEAKRIAAGLVTSISATAESRSNAAFVEIIDIIENGVLDTDTAANSLTFGTIASTDANDNNARQHLQNNREFIAQEALAYLNSIAPKKYIDEDIRIRDFRSLVDSLSYDILYGGNFATCEFAKDLFIDNVLRLEITTRLETVTVLQHLQTVVGNIVQGVSVTPTSGNTETQDTSASNATSSEATALSTYLGIVITQLQNNNLLNLPTIIYPSLVAGDAQLVAAKSAIDGGITDIQDDAIAAIDAVAVFTYNTTKCRRDVGLIVDALEDDLLNGGDEFSTEVQGEYFSSYIQQFNNGGFGGQENVTKGAIEYVATVVNRLLTGSYAAGLLEQDPLDADYIEPDFRYGTGEVGTNTIVSNLVDKMVFAFDRRYNPPKRNDQMDVFMMNDATIVRNVTVQGHGGFMVTLDPAGQILTKSPYIQTGSSFSQSVNRKAFRGGMFVDAYVGNLPAYIPTTIDTGSGAVSGKIDNFTLWIRSEEGQGLFIREPELPCPFYVEGRRYQVNSISDYDQANGWCKIYLDANSNDGVGYDQNQFEEDTGNISRTIFLQTAGNRSMLGNDFTQINDLGYGLVTTNGAFSEMVSMFTYYCQAAYYAKNGSEIRSTNGSNGYGNFGLVAEGADPNEIPDQVTYTHDMVYPAKTITFVSGGSNTNTTGTSSLYLTDMKYPPLPNSLIVVDHGGSVGTLRYRISSVSIDTTTTTTGGVYDNTIYRLQITGAAEGENGDFYQTIQDDIADGTYVEYRTSESHVFSGVRSRSTLVTRPSTAVNFDESDNITYRSIAFSSADAFGNPLDADVVNVTFEIPFDTVEIPTDPDRVASGFGGSAGDTIIPIRVDDALGNDLNATDLARLVRDLAGNTPPASNVAPNAYSLIERNIKFVQEETIAWVNATYGSLVYDEDLCYRDIGLIADAAAKDILFGGNANSVYAATEYFTGTTSYIPSGQKAETVAAIQYARDLIVDYILARDNSYVALNSAGVTQDISGSAAESGTDTRATDLIDIVADVVDAESLSGLPTSSGYQGGMIFAYQGKSHQIIDVTEDTSAVSPADFVVGRTYKILVTGTTDWNVVAGTSGVTYVPGDEVLCAAAGTGTGSGQDMGAYLVYTNWFPVSDISTNPGLGIRTAFSGSISKVLYAGVPEDTTAEITVAISLCRATGHDFTQIGTGSFNESNYPNVLLGPPEKSLAPFYVDSPDATSGQVWERRKGRVFWMSTDQYGFFRVGKFFSIDQAQGSITFSGEIGITGANELGFKKGVPIDEFSTDDTMADESDSAVPVEKAIVGYVNKRLGRDKNDNAVGGRIGPGFLPLSGSSEMEGELQMGNNKITNLAVPDNGSDASTKSYVDDKVLDFDSFDSLRNTSENRSAGGDILLYTGLKKVLVTVPEDSAGSKVFAVGDNIEDSSGAKTAIIRDIIQTTDDIVGEFEPGNNIWIIIYELTGGSADFNTAEVIEGTATKATVSSTILRGPFDEVGHARESSNSIINVTVTRTPGVFSGSLTDPIAQIDFQIENETIINADISPSASIQQSKLLMERAEPLASSTGLFGTDDAVGQSSRGLAAFDADHFAQEVQLTLSSAVTVDAGDYIYQGASVVGTVTQNRVANTIVYVRTANTFVPGVTVLERAVFTNGVLGAKVSLGVTVTDVDTSGYIDIKDRSLGYDKLQQIATDNVLGRSTAGTGDVESVTFNDVIDQGFGLQDVDFEDSEITVLTGQVLTFGSNISVADGATLVQNQGGGVTVQGTVQGKVDSETTVRVVNVINASTLAAATFNNASVSVSGGSALGSPTAVFVGENLTGAALVKQAEGVYGTTSISTGAANDSIARRTSTGALQANSYIIGGSSSNTILAESGGTLTFTTPGGGTILTANGSSDPKVNIPGIVDVGAVGITTESTFQAGSSFTGESFIQSDWTYTSFIEAPGERDANSTGISIGAGTGFASSAADTILLVTGGSERLRTSNTGTAITGTLGVSGDVAINTNKFNITAADGNTTIAGTLGVTGAISSSAGVSGTTGSFSSNVGVSGNLTVGGSVDLGDAAADTVSINGSVDTNIIPTGTRNIGSATSTWSTVYATTFSGTATTAKYADLAENYLADAAYEPGTVVVLGGSAEVTVTNVKGDTRVAGIVSTDPAHLMNSELQGDHVTAVALTGRVPCKVIGKVNKGDILVTSAIPGYAIVNNDPRLGTVIGKAVGAKADDGKGVVEVLVGKS